MLSPIKVDTLLTFLLRHQDTPTTLGSSRAHFREKVYSLRLPHVSCWEIRDVGKFIKMSEMESNEPAGEEERDWAAAKAFFDNLKTNKPRPVCLVSKCSLT